MEHKKTLAGIVLASYIAIASAFSFGQYKQPENIKFSLSQKPKTSYLSKENCPEMQSFKKLQEQLRKMGEDYTVMIAPGDNMPIIVPDMTKYPMNIVKPSPEWYGDDQFVIQPDKRWLPKGWLKKEFYNLQPKKHSPGALIYEYKKGSKI